LVQLLEFESAEAIFRDYAYFSSYSDSWLRHASEFAENASNRFGLEDQSRVVEVGSNDGYLLQYFLARGINVLGVEPAMNVAVAAEAKGIRTVTEFFGRRTAEHLVNEGIQADLLVGNNVLAHVPDLNDFVAGLKAILAADGVLTMEFPHLIRLIEENQFDTIYHEHFSYFSFSTAEQVFAEHGIVLFDVEELDTHGGSLRIFGRHVEDLTKPVEPKVKSLRQVESSMGYDQLEAYLTFQERVKKTKRGLLAFLIEAKEQEQSIVGYGAPAKGNTLLNYCGIRTDFLDYTVDRSPHKQNMYLPGTHIEISSPDRIWETRPDYVLILPWNLRYEITKQMADIREWGGRFVVPIPEVEIS
jgi:SAM-dependent methyltransferase